MDPIVPSYIAKVGRAEKHLGDLEAAIKTWGGVDGASRPYTVRQRPQSQRQRRPKWELHFTRAITNTDVPLIAADAIYNLRSALDHLMCACVKAEDRRSVFFPIFWEGVWDPAIPGEDGQRTKDRERWASYIRKLQGTDAVVVLKGLQPPDDARDDEQGNLLRILNHLSNADRHTKLPVVAHGLKGMIIVWEFPDGSIQQGWAPPDAEGTSFLEDHAEVQGVPNGTVHRESYGVPAIVISGAVHNRNISGDVNLVDFIADAATLIRDRIIPNLVPYVWKPGGRRRR